MEHVRLKNERGLALIAVLMILSLLLAVASGALMMGQLDLRIMSNFKTGTEAFYHAEAGMQATIQELDDNDGTTDFASVSLPLTLSSTTFGSGNYTVTLTLVSSSPRTIEISSVGTAPNSASRTVKASFQTNTVPPDKALITNGDLLISGSINLMGTCGGAHTNNNMTLKNSAAQMADGFTSSGTMSITGTPCIGSDTCDDSSPSAEFVLENDTERTAYADAHDAQPIKSLPTINPADLAQRVADLGSSGGGYILNDDGTVSTGGTCGSNGLCSGGTTVTPPSNFPFRWKASHSRWETYSLGGSTAALNGVFYAETSVDLGNHGTTSSPWQATTIARDSVDWTGGAVVKPFDSSDSQLDGILVMTGNDLEISGNMGVSGTGGSGAVLVHQQIKFNGSLTIYGYVFAGNGSPTWTGDPFATSTSGRNLTSSQSVDGTPTIIYDCSTLCNNSACGIQKVQMVAGSWSEF